MTDETAEMLALVLAELRARPSGAKATVEAAEAWSRLMSVVRKTAMQVVPSLQASRLLDAEEISQQVLITLQSEAVVNRLVHSRNPGPYLRGIIRHSALDALRRASIRTSSLTEMGDFPLLFQSHEAAAVGPGTDSIVQLRLKSAIQQLSDKERRLLVRRFWQDQTIGEIARTDGVPYSTAAVRLFRLIRRLRMELDVDQ